MDVRSVPRSRHNPQFNRETLAARLRSARIGYVYLRKLGGRRHTRRDSPNTGWRNKSFRGFADYMQTPEFGAGLKRLIKPAKQKKTAILCAEAVPWLCHRSLIADALVVRGTHVADIISGKRSRPHSLTSFGRARGPRVTYRRHSGSYLDRRNNHRAEISIELHFEMRANLKSSRFNRKFPVVVRRKKLWNEPDW